VAWANGCDVPSPVRGNAVTVLLVDAANVVGARPDGWWRDRAGAAGRLLAGLALLPGRVVPGPDGGELVVSGVVAVLEGRARSADVPNEVRVVLADGSGDDAVVAEAVRLQGAPLLVVTADRGLRDRLPPGTPVAGPGWLRRLLDEPPA
jgi:hypothetical protein